MNCTISLTQGQFAIVDASDLEWLSQWKWHARWHESTKSFYAQRALPREGRHIQASAQMHRIILNASRGVKIDHANCNTLDNRRTNLRIATSSQNTMNSCVRSDNQSGLKGVSRVYKRNWWESRITLNGKTIRLGQFKTAEEAHAAYCEAATRLHGEFARFA